MQCKADWGWKRLLIYCTGVFMDHSAPWARIRQDLLDVTLVCDDDSNRKFWRWVSITLVYTNLKFGVKRPRFFLFLPFPRNKTLSGNGMDLERKAQAGMGHSPPDLEPGQLIHFQSQPGKFELKFSICQIDKKYIFVPKCLAPCHPKLLKTIYKSLLDNTFWRKGIEMHPMWSVWWYGGAV